MRRNSVSEFSEILQIKAIRDRIHFSLKSNSKNFFRTIFHFSLTTEDLTGISTRGILSIDSVVEIFCPLEAIT